MHLILLSILDIIRSLPSIHEWNKDPNRIGKGKKVDEDFTYCSDNNSDWMEVIDLKTWIEINKDKIGKI